MSRTYPAVIALLTLPLSLSPSSTAAQTPPVDTARYGALRWREIGPFRGGRVDAVSGVAGQPLVYYMGATGGGVWKTHDGGLTWDPVSDKDFTAGSIGALAVAESDPNVIYAGTGEETVRGNVSPGDGMYKSTDAGKTWSRIGLADAGQIGRIAIHPRNADLVYVAAMGHAFGPNAMRGLYRSADGGKTWQRILSRNDSTGAVDVVLDPANPRIVYASLWQEQRTPWDFSSGGAGSGLYKSTDGGDTWTELTRKHGMPEGVIGRIGIAVSPVNPDRVWAVVEARAGGVFRSDDAGDTWHKTSDDHEIRQRAWYFSNIYADPASADVVYALNVSAFKSVDGGVTFKEMDAVPHGDNHALWIDPADPKRMVLGNDGGATVSNDGGSSWTTLDNQPTAQFYHVIATTHWPYQVCGAQQDNSTVCIATSTDGAGITDRDWEDVGGGESGWIAARADTPDVVFAGSYGNHITRLDRRNHQERNINPWPDNPMGHPASDLKYRFQWTFPIVIAPTNSADLYIGSQVLFKSTNEGSTWQVVSPDLTRNDTTRQRSSGGPITKDNTSVEYYGTIFTIAPSPRDSATIWVGTDDGLVQLTRDGGKTWTNVTPKDITAGTQVSMVDASAHDPATAYIAATRYKLDDFAPYAFVTHDYGKSWRKIVSGIPGTHFVRVVRQDPVRPNLLYAGTEFGVYASFNDGASWQSLRLNLPVVPVHDLTVKDNDLIAATHGRSFWIIDGVGPLRELAGSEAQGDRALYQPADAWRTGGFRGRRVATAGQNAPRGVQFYAFFKDKPDSAVTLEVRDGRDSLVRRWSTKPVDPEDSIDVKAGMNHFVWDLRYPGAHRFKGMILWGGGTGGPVAVPGTYTVRISTRGWSASRSFQVKEDPRVPVATADLQKEFDLLIRIRDRMSQADDAVKQIRDLVSQLDGVETRVKGQTAAAAVTQRADSLKSRLEDIEKAIYQTQNQSGEDPLNYPIRLNNRIAGVAGVVGSADAAPTEQSYQVFDLVSGLLQVQLDRLTAVVTTDIAAFNQAVAAQNVPAVIVR